jgi:hypothetical protein
VLDRGVHDLTMWSSGPACGGPLISRINHRRVSVDRMGSLLGEVRRAIRPIPRWRGVLAHLRLRVRPPGWFPQTDDLMEVYRRQGTLMREGDIVWGALVQANAHLFQPGPDDHPAMAIHSEDPYFEDDPARLAAVARRLSELKGTTPDDPGERRWAEMITDEMERGMGWVAPKSCTGGRQVISTGFMVFRRHLPDGVLRCGWFPLLTHPETPAVMIVPSKYWPPDLVRIWSAGGKDG